MIFNTNCHIDYATRRMQRGVSKNHALIVVEDLRIKNMSSSASGTKDAPGKNIKAKSGLNKSILDQGWGEFVRQLEYKQDWNGNLLVKIPAPNTSITCSKCSFKSKENRQSQEKFECQSCGYKNNADLNAALNVLAAGHAVLACEWKRISGRKQELLRKSDQVLACAVA